MTVDGVVLDRPTPGPDLFTDLGRHGSAPALVTGDAVVDYADLARRVRERALLLGQRRRLVLLRCRNDVETVVTYLAAIGGGHVVLLCSADPSADALVDAYRPDVVASGDVLDEQHPGSCHDLHPDLALLLSTSGSTGSPKLVRLSRASLRSNAESIASFLGLTSADRAATTLPLHYCYGLSVLNSHLLAGASLLLSERSVADPRFWESFQAHGATSFAGVPHTFELLERAGFPADRLPSLRYVTQAGGRLHPDRVRRFAELGRRTGFDLVVMYGQTEATARMAYLPPRLAEARPGTIGIPIPGGSLRVDTVGYDDLADGVGELVYTGPNVMLGYAESPDDLALGRTVTELRTGDLGRQHADGIYELVGRSSRFVKVCGLRVDLDRVERLARDAGVEARAVGGDETLTVFVTRHRDVETVRGLTARCGLPAHAVRAVVVACFPVTAAGKPDYPALVRHAAVVERNAAAGHRPGRVGPADVRELFATLLGRPDARDDDSFVGLGGDSLSYVEVSVRLDDLLGGLPGDWPERSARDLAAWRPPGPALDSGATAVATPTPAPGRARRSLRWTTVESSVAVRAVAIVIIVASHANVMMVMGGAHVLLGLAGFNLARFQLHGGSRGLRLRSILRGALRIAVPSFLWIAGVALVNGMYTLPTALLLNNLLGSDTWDTQWQFWFLEPVVWFPAAVAVLLTVRRLDALERRRPYAFASAVVAVTLATRYLMVGVTAGPTERYALPVVLWCIALGWLVARSDTRSRRVLASAAVAAATYGFFGDPVREALVVAGFLVLTWVPVLRVPRGVASALATLAASSLFVYLTHWQVYPHLEMQHPWAATASSFVVGIAVWRLYTAVGRRVTGLLAGSWPALALRGAYQRRGAVGPHHQALAALPRLQPAGGVAALRVGGGRVDVGPGE